MVKISTSEEKIFMQLAFDKADQHLGSTKNNPSVGCVVVKNGSVISTSVTSINGRPHAETNALKLNKNFKGATMFATLEPCSHYGKTPPCTKEIIKKKISKVYYPLNDIDRRTSNKSKKILSKKKIIVKVGILNKFAKNFYKSYFVSRKRNYLPYLDAKIAISDDFFSVSKKNKWITNDFSRSRVNFIRSKYDCILSTYKSVNKDNSKLDCRLDGIKHLSPARVIIDKDLKLKKKLNLYDRSSAIPTFIITSNNNKNKEIYFKKNNIKILKINTNMKHFKFEQILSLLKKRGFSRILCEAGLFTTKNL